MLDIFKVFFLVRFTKKPLRFFGMIGVAIFCVGHSSCCIWCSSGLYFHQPARRPAGLAARLADGRAGVQMFALGLLGEFIIFTHAGGKDYQVDRVIQYSGALPGTVAAASESARAAAE